jgi:hypothetical protein
MELTSREKEQKYLELKLNPGEKIVGAKCTHTNNTQDFKTILQIEFLVIGQPYKVTLPIHHCTNNNKELFNILSEMKYEEMPEELQQLKIKVRTSNKFAGEKLIRAIDKRDWKCHGIRGFAECYSGDNIGKPGFNDRWTSPTNGDLTFCKRCM